MIKLKLLTEKKKKKIEKKKEPSYPDIIMLPDTVIEKDKFIKFMKDVYNANIEFNNEK